MSAVAACLGVSFRPYNLIIGLLVFVFYPEVDLHAVAVVIDIALVVVVLDVLWCVLQPLGELAVFVQVIALEGSHYFACDVYLAFVHITPVLAPCDVKR